MKEFEIIQDTGKNLRTIISKELVKSPVVAVKELVSNSYDADAEKVFIKTDLENKTLTIEDDGFGMQESDLEIFLRMGDSEKLKKPVTPKGRDCIGKFGIATVLLQYLGNTYDLDTWHNNTHVSGTEVFSEERGLEYIVGKNQRNRNGTRIFIKGVETLGTKQFSIQSLKKALTWEVPNEEDLSNDDSFSIFLNGEKMIRKHIKPQQEFEFEETLPTTGHVTMDLKYFKSDSKVNGIYIYVNGRSVGDPKYFDLRNVSRLPLKRIFARVTANGLKQYISFDRDHFKEDNEAFNELKKWVYSNVRELKRSLEVTPTGSTYEKSLTRDTLKQTLVTGFLSEDNGSKSNSQRLFVKKPKIVKTQNYESGIKFKPRLTNDTEDQVSLLGLHTIKEGIGSPQARLDLETRELFFNVSHPWYKSHETKHNEVMKMQILLGTCFGLAEGFYKEFGGAQDYIDDFNTLCWKVLSQESLESVKLRSQGNENQKFVPFRRYGILEAYEKLGINLSTFHKLVKAGVLKEEADKFMGSELNECINKLANHTPACIIMEEYAVEREVTHQRKRQLAEKIDTTLVGYTDILPFLQNIGVSHPFFLISNEHVDQFKGLYAQGAIKKYSNFDSHFNKYKHLFDEGKGINKKDFAGLEMLCDMTRGTPFDVFKTISYAQRRGIELPFKEERNEIIYSLNHFKKARKRYVESNEND